MDYTRKMIYYSFIYEHRYRIFITGFITTLVLTIASFIFGTLFGVAMCAMKRSHKSFLIKTAQYICSFLIMIPTMVLLLLFVYVVFGSVSLSLEITVIIALTLKTGAYICEILCTSLDAIDPGELEAARTLGMNSLQTFRYIILPQIIGTGLELYKNQFITTMQETSVVGYIALIDLTRASSIIGARTMDSLFSLIFITIMYFLIGFVFKKLIDLLKVRKHLGVNRA